MKGVREPMTFRGLSIGVLIVLTGCVFADGSSHVPIPSGDHAPLIPDIAIGDPIELGQGTSFGRGWRYFAFDSDDGLCVQLDVGTVASGGTVSSMNCGPGFAAADSVFLQLNYGASLNGAVAADGLVRGDVEAVSLRGERGSETAGILMELRAAGEDAKAFVGFLDLGDRIVSITAFDEHGQPLETYHIPDPP
jgi:hypothetical protein